MRRETLACLALVLITTVYWAVQYHPFLLPNNDYYSFELVAQSFGSFELPRSFKRLPAFPAFMAALAPLMPEPWPEMHAALVLNFAFGLGALVLLYLYSRRLFQPGAILPSILLATTVQFHAMALQPLVEPSLGFFVLLTFVLYQRRSLWQYAAAFGVGLGRAEAAVLVPILFLLNWREEGHFWRHAVLGGLAASGILVWTGLGAVYGSGQSFYLELMQGMGWNPSPGFYRRNLRESFAFLYFQNPVLHASLILATAVPLALGVVGGLRRFRRDTVLMLAFYLVSTTVVVIFGVNKPRYAYPTFWIPLVFVSYGLIRMADLFAARLQNRLGQARWPTGLATAAWLACLATGLVYVGSRPHTVPPVLNQAFAFACVALSVFALMPLARSPLRRALIVLALTYVSASMLTGLARKTTALYRIHYTNYGSWLLSHWIYENAEPHERAILLGKKHILHVRPIDRRRLRNFSKVRVDTLEELETYMRDANWHLVAWTHRGEVRNPSAAWYHEKLNVGLAEAFRSGGPVEGFEHIATLPVPPEVGESDVQIYRPRP
jgi:hypothetical protein